MDKNIWQKTAQRAHSTKSNLEEAVYDIKVELGPKNNFEVIIFFASPEYNHEALAIEFQKAFPSAQTFGCTTAGETFGGKIFLNSIVAMGFDKSIISDFKVEIVENSTDIGKIDKAINSLKDYFGKEDLISNTEKYVGIVLSDGLSFAEEGLISRLNQLIPVDFVGGSAGDNWRMMETAIFCNGKAYKKAALLAIFKPTRGFKIIKTQSLVPIGKVAKAELVDEDIRCLKKVDGMPAGLFFAEQVKCDKSKISDNFVDNAIGIMIYNEAYSHDIKSVDSDYNLYLYSAIPMGAEIQVLQSIDIINSIKNVVVTKLEPLPRISAILDFSCGTRLLKTQRDHEEAEIEKIWSDFPVIGFGTYGEFYISFINQTTLLLVFL